MVSVVRAVKSAPKSVLINGGLGLGGILASRFILSRVVGDNTIISALAKGATGVAVSTMNKGLGVGIIIDAADDVANLLGVMPGSGGAQGASVGGGQGTGVF